MRRGTKISGFWVLVLTVVGGGADAGNAVSPCCTDDGSGERMKNYDESTFSSYNAHWDLDSRPRRIALIVDDAQEEYRKFAKPILENLKEVVNVFRETSQHIEWSVWSRRHKDGISNAMDRWYGPQGIKSRENKLYVYRGRGTNVLREVRPNKFEKSRGTQIISSADLDIFWNFDNRGRSILDSRLHQRGIDTVVLIGLWTDQNIMSTAYAAYSRGYDVVVISDAVATATPNQHVALKIINGTCGKVLSTADVVEYMRQTYIKPNDDFRLDQQKRGFWRAIRRVFSPFGSASAQGGAKRGMLLSPSDDEFAHRHSSKSDENSKHNGAGCLRTGRRGYDYSYGGKSSDNSRRRRL